MRFRVLAIASLITLAGCHLQTGAPSNAPSNVIATSGDGQVTITFDQEPGLTYWIFFQPGSSVVPAATGVPVIRGAISPRVVSNLANETQYAFIMNATKDDSAAGPSSQIVVATPRLAGAEWFPGAAVGTTQNLNGIASSGSRLVVVGDATTIFAGDFSYTSANPPVTAWTPATSLPAGFPAATNFSAVTFSGAFVALGAEGSILTSADGLTWTPPGSATNPVLSAGMNGIAFLAGVYVAVGNGGKIFTSSDLVTWTQAIVLGVVSDDLYSVSVLNGVFVATGANGRLLTSTSGSTWVVQNSNTPNALRGAAFRSTPTVLTVVVGDAGTIVTSTDGISWTATTLPGAPNLRSVTNGGALTSSQPAGARFLAVGQGGTVVFSDDASIWSSPSTPPGSADLARVIFTPGMYVAVGAAGANAIAK